MDISMRMVLVAGMLTLVLLVAVVGMVSADTVSWEPAVASGPAGRSHPL